MLKVGTHICIPLSEFEFTFVRSSGPGGQNVNKVNSKAVLRWNVAESPTLPLAIRLRFLHTFPTKLTKEGVFVITSDRYRDQNQNLEDCLEKLSEMLLTVEKPPKARKKTRPTFSSKLKKRDSKSKRSEVKKNRGMRHSD